MAHPIFSLLVNRPELLFDHVAAYAALAREEASTAARDAGKRALAWVLAILASVVFLVLAGVALMLGATLQLFHPALLLVPGAMLAVAALCAFIARKPLPGQAFGELKAQLDADTRALRAAGALG